MNKSYHDVQEEEASSVARQWRPGCSAPPWIAHRRSSSGRWPSVDEELVDLRHVKTPNLVRAMRKEELRWKEGERRHGDAASHQKWGVRRRRVTEL